MSRFSSSSLMARLNAPVLVSSPSAAVSSEAERGAFAKADKMDADWAPDCEVPGSGSVPCSSNIDHAAGLKTPQGGSGEYSGG